MPPQTQTPHSYFAPLEPDDASTHVNRQFIGALGLALPFLVWLINELRPMKELPGPWPLDSISAYYYTGAVSVFVGMLFALAIFLATYQGFQNQHKKRDRYAAVIASLAAIGVASFPTIAPAGVLSPSWWDPYMKYVHYSAAAVLFGSFMFFCFKLFPQTKSALGTQLPTGKRNRNRLYKLCGWIIIVCMAWAGSAYFTEGPIFWPETIALFAFALSWLVKGKAEWTVVEVARRIRQPVYFAKDIWKAIF